MNIQLKRFGVVTYGNKQFKTDPRTELIDSYLILVQTSALRSHLATDYLFVPKEDISGFLNIVAMTVGIRDDEYTSSKRLDLTGPMFGNDVATLELSESGIKKMKVGLKRFEIILRDPGDDDVIELS